MLQVWEMLSEEMLLEIRERYTHYGETEKLNKRTAVHDIRLLLEEIDRQESVINRLVLNLV